MKNGAGSEDDLLGLHALACAPVCADTLLWEVAELEPSDFTVQQVMEELRFVRDFASGGLNYLCDIFGKSSFIDDSGRAKDSEELSYALLCAGAYAKRLAAAASALNTFCNNASNEEIRNNPANLIKHLEESTHSGKRPRLNAGLDFTLGARWAQLEIPKRGVDFKSTAAIVGDGDVQEQKLKTEPFQRKKQRNPTGFHKFNFKDLKLDESDLESDRATRDDLSTRASAKSGAASSEEEGPLERAGSTVAFHGQEMIQDTSADKQWAEQERHQRRFSRIRNRVPTGHPSTLKLQDSGELANIVHQFEKSLSSIQTDRATEENTESNRHIQLSPGEDEGVAARGSRGGMKNVKMAKDA